MKTFNFNEDVVSTNIVVTDGFFDGGAGTKAGSNYTTSSLSAAQKNYYYNVQFNSKDHFSCTYGHIGGSGSAEQSTTVEGTTQAVYKQFYNFTENNRASLKNGVGWIINSVTQSDAYMIAAERLQMKDRLNPGTWTITLSGSTTAGVGAELKLTDNSKTTDPTAAPFGEKYIIYSGSAGSVQATGTEYGHFYPDAGLFILSAAEVSGSLPGSSGWIQSGSGDVGQHNGLAPDTRVNSAADNAWKITRALEQGSVTLRSEENQYIYDYFCRAKANEVNYSTNLTFWSGSDYIIRHSDMQNNPQTYISEVGLYDGGGDLMAVGKLSAPLEKNFSSEAIIKVRLTY
jgi:hypothetical protein